MANRKQRNIFFILNATTCLTNSAVAVIVHLIPTYINFGPIHEGYPHWYQLGVFLAIPLLAFYNGQLGKKSKVMSWSFYVFYPAHLILIYLLDRFTTLSLLVRWLQ